MAELGWSQQDLVRAAQTGKNTVSDFLTGRKSPRLGTLARFESALGLTPGSLANCDPSAPATSPAPVEASGLLAAASDMALLAELGRRLDRARGVDG